MITVKVQGGLGNQIFHYAAALQLLKNVGELPILNISFFNDEKISIHYKLNKFNIDYIETREPIEESRSGGLVKRICNKLFYKTTFFSIPGSRIINGDALTKPSKKLSKLDQTIPYILEGWLQTTDLFEEVKDKLSKTLWLKDKSSINKELCDSIKNSNSVAIHVRRGDMLLNPNFTTLDVNYYKQALDEIQTRLKNPVFFVFSDEPTKVKEMFKDITVKMNYITEQSESLGYYGTKGDYIDFELMRLCKHYITANSTFSWWPAYLCENPDKIVVAPRNWYKNNILQARFERSGLLQNKWIILN